jgi:small-conductance mechanosensitive channel
MPAILQTPVAGQTLFAWIAFLAIWIFVYLVLRVPKTIIAQRITALAPQTQREVWSLVGELVRRVSSIFLLTLGFYLGSLVLTLSARARWDIDAALVVAFIYQGALWMDEAGRYSISWALRARVGDEASVGSTLDALRFFARLIIWSIAVLLILSNLQVNVTTLIAGLGVGGVAIALAVNQILGDFFASMAILLDKPFDVGHFITFDNFAGSVEHIGFKTTRIRSITGEQLIVGNASLLQSRIRNYRRLRERRVLFIVGVKEDSGDDKIERLPSVLKEIIQAVPKVRFERAHLREYIGGALNYEVVYWVQDQELMSYLDAQQKISLDIFKRLRELSIPMTGITQPAT